MLFTRSIYLGIDPTSGQHSIAYAALDEDLRLVALGQGDDEEVLAFVGGQQAAIAAVNAPLKPNLGIMADEGRRARLSPLPKPGRWEDCRLAEYELLRRGIRIHQTPSDSETCKPWMHTGFVLYKRLLGLGFQAYPAGGAEMQFLESSPLACYSVWLGKAPFRKGTLEGRLQRQLVLYDLGLEIPDPMLFFEEITRYRILQGSLPEDILYAAGELDALAVAYAAWFAGKHAHEITLLGDPQEGRILIPAKELKAGY